MLERRKAGILLPISSLPSPYGIGTFGKAAYDFVDFLVEAKQAYWQLLPINPTSFGDSPYSSPSTFAGNPYFIDLDLLAKDKLLKKEDYAHLNNNKKVDYAYLYQTRFEVLKIAYNNFMEKTPVDYASFVNNNYYWLHDYALFMALKQKYNGASFDLWDDKYKYYNPENLKDLSEDNIGFYYFLQYEFTKQWNKLKEYANNRGISIIGDIPIYVAYDSSDVWANPKQFQLNENLKPSKVAGCPPDAFTEDGQLWGNPLYDYKYMKQDKYSWWIKRIKRAFELYDIVRIDHFRGFEAYWAVPAGDKTAKNGKWVKGPNYSLFQAIKAELGNKEFIAEDLGFLTEGVYKLLKKTGFPGMKILEFAFDDNPENEYLPSSYKDANCVCYIGTHDNHPAIGWYKSLSGKALDDANNHLHIEKAEDAADKLINIALESIANTVIIQMQDYLHLDSKARMNVPSTNQDNWVWRLPQNYRKEELVEKMSKMIDKANR